MENAFLTISVGHLGQWTTQRTHVARANGALSEALGCGVV